MIAPFRNVHGEVTHRKLIHGEPRKRLAPQIACLFSMLGMAWGSAAVNAAEPASFFPPMMTVLEQHCIRCHDGPDAKGGLDLASRDGWLKGGDGGPAIVPGKPDESFLLERVKQGSMPPLNDGRALHAEEIAILAQWIQSGAVWGPVEQGFSPSAASERAKRPRGPCCESCSGRRRRAIRGSVRRPGPTASLQSLPTPRTSGSAHR